MLEAILALVGVATGAVVTQFVNWRVTKSQLLQQRDAQITDRFIRAIELFGSPELWTRIGGIRALERVAIDSEKDHWPVMEVLTAYVRDYKRLADQWFRHPDTWLVPPDIQSIATVLGSRNVGHESGQRRLDLTGADLRGVDLRGAKLDAAILVNSDLQKANLFGTKLRDANLQGANLEGADLRDSELSGAILSEARLNGAFINSLDLSVTVGLIPEQLSGVYGKDSAKLPDYLRDTF